MNIYVQNLFYAIFSTIDKPFTLRALLFLEKFFQNSNLH